MRQLAGPSDTLSGGTSGEGGGGGGSYEAPIEAGIQAKCASDLANRTSCAMPFLRRRCPKHGKVVSRNAISHFALRDDTTINLFVRGRDRDLPPVALLRRSLPT